MAVHYSFGQEDKKDVFTTITAAKALGASDSAKTFLLDAAAGAQIDLPLIPGFKARFIVSDNFASTNWTLKSATSVIYGNVIVDGAHVVGAAENTISFVASAESIGDFVDVICDGTLFFVSGSGVLSGSITLTDA
jgi:hypothetical protein